VFVIKFLRQYGTVGLFLPRFLLGASEGRGRIKNWCKRAAGQEKGLKRLKKLYKAHDINSLLTKH
jgi:hypothetical protein